jgi:hypothetical protein
MLITAQGIPANETHVHSCYVGVRSSHTISQWLLDHILPVVELQHRCTFLVTIEKYFILVSNQRFEIPVSLAACIAMGIFAVLHAGLGFMGNSAATIANPQRWSMSPTRRVGWATSTGSKQSSIITVHQGNKKTKVFLLPCSIISLPDGRTDGRTEGFQF